jgi:hypothetical protein
MEMDPCPLMLFGKYPDGKLKSYLVWPNVCYMCMNEGLQH